MEKIKKLLRNFFSPLFSILFPIKWKEINEMYYWKQVKRKEGFLRNEHYKYFYTEYFGLNEKFYENKTVLDIGCGPRGSLEWADMASRRIGLDPLANEYLKLGANQHKMTYIDAPSESIPLGNAECDVVCSFNSLDHVFNVKSTINEIKRVTKSSGIFLLIVEVNHPISDTEPHSLTPKEIVQLLAPEFELRSLKIYKPKGNDIYGSIQQDKKYKNDIDVNCRGVLAGSFIRV